MKRSLIIDGNNFYNISYYAAKSNGFGEYVAIGFFQRIAEAYKVFKSEHEFLFVVWDSPKNLRKEKFPYYKGHRTPKPDGFYDMMPYIKATLTMRQVQQYEIEGYEGDDLIAQLVAMSKEKGHGATIASGDHDMYQLLDKNVTVYDPRIKQIINDEDFRKENLLEPNQWRYVKALMGDTSDNISGVKGIGDKGALKLIQQFGDLDKLFSSKFDGVAKGIVSKLTKVDADYDAKKSAYEALELIDFKGLNLEYPLLALIDSDKVNASIHMEPMDE